MDGSLNESPQLLLDTHCPQSQQSCWPGSLDTLLSIFSAANMFLAKSKLPFPWAKSLPTARPVFRWLVHSQISNNKTNHKMSYMIRASVLCGTQNIYVGLYGNEQTFISSVAFAISSLCLWKALAGSRAFCSSIFSCFPFLHCNLEVPHLQRAPHFLLVFLHGQPALRFNFSRLHCVLAVTYLTVHKNEL